MTKVFYSLAKSKVQYFIPKDPDAKLKVTVSYRYISWFVTSLFYLTHSPNNSLKHKVIVVLSLLIFSRVVIDLYINRSSRVAIQSTIILETIGLTALLIPTGGLESPFIWYALNPVLIASSYLKPVYSWLYLIFYLTAELIISSGLFNDQGMTMANIIREKSDIIHVYILTTAAMGLLAQLVKHLDNQTIILKKQRLELLEMNNRLEEANTSVNRSMEYVLSLYRIIEAFSASEDTGRILNQLVESTVKIMESKASFLWLAPHKQSPNIFVTKNFSSRFREEFQTYFNSQVATLDDVVTQHELNYKECLYLLVAVKSSSRFYGYIGVELGQSHKLTREFSNSGLLTFLADLTAVVLERSYLENISSKLMIMNEQNRIGNEIHDNVSQRLFSILCGIHALNTNWESMVKDDIASQFELIKKSIKEACKELRSSIYRLSKSEQDKVIFKETIENYLADFASLNNIKAKIKFHGEADRLDSTLKQTMYRIIMEATGNAVRHGNCTEVEVLVCVDSLNAELCIKDNGMGFDVALILKDKSNRGLGIDNMQALVQACNGSSDLYSESGLGTEVRMKFPLSHSKTILTEKQGGAA